MGYSNEGKIKMPVRTRLAEIRKKRGLSRMDIVREANVSYPTVHKWEKEVIEEIDSTVLINMCRVLKCGIEDFIIPLGDDNEPVVWEVEPVA